MTQVSMNQCRVTVRQDTQIACPSRPVPDAKVLDDNQQPASLGGPVAVPLAAAPS